jgi:hypothetical protein
MAERRSWWWVLLLAALVGGCGQVEENGTPAAPEDPPERLGDRIDVSLADLLGKPRSELAALADEWTARARAQETARRDRRLAVGLLPDARFPLIVPVLREARFSPEAGFSLPPYVAEGTKDSPLALHLARYGDDEAARKLVDPADAEAVRQIDACRYGRSYPLEWSRLVGLMLHEGQLRLAAGEPEAATELVVLHRQLKEVLDPKAAAGPLGAALLPGGRQALTLGVPAWRGSKRTALLADDVEAALTAWGKVPAPTLAVPAGAGRADMARLLRSPGQGHVIPALSTLRGLDLLDLPLPPEGAEAVLALFDASDRLSEVLATYRPGVASIYPTPRDLASALERPGDGGKDDKTPGLLSHSYSVGDFTCEAVIASRGHPVGAFARFAAGKARSDALPRDFGIVHLDRSFEQNRARLAPDQAGRTVRTERPAVLAKVKNLLRGVALTQVILERAGDQDATARVLFRYANDGETPPLHQMALNLWASGGPARITGHENENGGFMAVVWEDDRTRLTLRLPYASGQAIELEAEDAGTDPGRRAADAAAFDRQERKARLAAGAPVTRLPRHLDHEGLQLGMTRAQALQALPRGENVVKQNVAGGVMALTLGEAPKGSPYVARQTFVRFGSDDKVAELRTRYGDGASGGNAGQAVLNALKQRYGVPAELSATWARVWDDLPARKPAAALYRWQDDLSVLTCQRDAGGVEVTLRDASAPDADAAAILPPPEFLPRGPAGEVRLGATREEVLRAAGNKPQVLADGALVLAPHAPAPYDTLLVWLQGDRVTQIVARYAQAAPPKAPAAKLSQLLTEAWGRDARALGWPAWQDVREGQGPQGLGWQDEHTRVRLFWQESENGPPRLYAEWKELGK